MGNFYMESTQINYRRDDKPKTVDQKLQELSETSAIDTDIAPVFKSTNTYQPGDMVYYRNKLYVFNVEHTGAWAAADVTATDVTTELSSLNSNLTSYEQTTNAALAVPENTGKNVLPLTLANLKSQNTTGTWSGNVYTLQNVTFTVNANDDGAVTSITTSYSGTYADAVLLSFKLPKGTYIMSSGFSETYGSIDTILTKDGIVIARGNNVTPGQTFTLDSDATVIWNLRVTATELTAYPMIRPATITDPTFAPYIPSVETRLDTLERGIYGRVAGSSSVEITLTGYLYVLYTWRDADAFTTMYLITKYWGGTPSVQAIYRDSNSKVTVTGLTDNKISIANSSTSHMSYTLKQISFDTV